MKVRLWGPAGDMAASAQGYFVQGEDGKFFRSTVVTIPSKVAEEAHLGEDGIDGDKEAEQSPGNVPGGEAEMEDVKLWEDEDAEEEEVNGESSEKEDRRRHLHQLQELAKKAQDFGNGLEGLAMMDCGVNMDYVEEKGKNGRECLEIAPHDLPRRRYLAKSAPRLVEAQPRVFRMDARGGEQAPNNWAGGSHPMTCQLQEEERLEHVMLKQHVALRKWIEEVSGMTTQGVATAEEVQTVADAKEEATVLEMLLQDLSIKSIKRIQEEAQPQVLQTQLVAMDEVRRNMQDWKQAFADEVEALTATALEPIDEARFNELLSGPMEVECLPMKGVASLKPPCRRKARIVVCGNYATEKEDEGLDNSVSGVDSVVIRTFLNVAVHRGWGASCIDVSKAFLQAPRRTASKRITIGDPPRIVKDMGLVPRGQKWIIHQALYGLQESPGDWSAHRDAELQKMRWSVNGERHQFVKTAERNVWRIVKDGGGPRGLDGGSVLGTAAGGETMGFLLVYVDDMMIVADNDLTHSTANAIGQRWQCSQPEFLQEGKSMRFCGFELMKEKNGGIRLDQAGYTQELVKKYGIDQPESCPLPKLTDEEQAEEQYTAEDLRSAQSVVGELLWLSTRTRPDLSFGVGLLGRWVHKKPRAVTQLGMHMMKYVYATQTWGLVYERCRDGDLGEDGELQQTRSTSRVQAYADISFAPAREAYRSIQGIGIQHGRNLLAWETGRQPFVCASTAESELVSYCECHQVTEALVGLLEIAGFSVERQLYGDNKAALAAITSESGSWRTRHLRLRAFALREALSEPGRRWVARHLAGSMLLADGFTKPLQGGAFEAYRRKLGLYGRRAEEKELSMKSLGLQLQGREATVALLLGSLGLWKSGQKTLAAVIGAVAGIGMVAGWATSERRTEDEDEGIANRSLKINGDQHERSGLDSGQVRGFNGCQDGRALQSSSRPGQFEHPCLCGDSRANCSKSFAEEGLCDDECGDSRAWKQSSDGGEVPRLCAIRVQKGKKEKEEDHEEDEVVRVAGDLKKLDITTTVTVEINSRNAGRRGRQVQEGVAEPGASGSGRPTGSSNLEIEPWKLPKFNQAPKGADKWDLTMISEGWLVRSHGSKGRVRPFHPIHKSCPIHGDELSGERVTKLFNNDSPQGELLHDRWMEQRTWQRAGPWSGYTFLRIKKNTDGEKSKGQGGYGTTHQDRSSTSRAAEGSSEAEDGYSFVSDGESSW